jgi:hypothetical protein
MKLIWALGCLLIGAAVVPVSYYVQWSMRDRLMVDYAYKKDCERVSKRTITQDMEEAPEATLESTPELAEEHYCRDLLRGIATYRQAIVTRSVGFGLVVFIGLMFVRFLMIPFRDTTGWQSDY